MPFEDEYIKVKHPLSLNKWADPISTYSNMGDFEKLYNYVPERGCVNTRLGIVGLAHTPQTTNVSSGVWSPIETSGKYTAVQGDFALLAGIFPFNSSATLGVNWFTTVDTYSALGSVGLASESGHATSYIGDKVEGAGSLIMTDNTALNTAAGNPATIWGMRTLNAFPWWMPGDSGELTKKFLITYWIKPFRANPSANAEWHFTFGNSSDDSKLAFGIRHFDTNLQNWWSDSSGGTLSNLNLPGIMAEGQWQFIAAWYDGDTQFEGLYHWNDVTKVETYTAVGTTPTPLGGFDHFYHHSVSNTINGPHLWSPARQANILDGSAAMEGLIDYCTMWFQPMHIHNSSNITLARIVRAMAWVL